MEVAPPELGTALDTPQCLSCLRISFGVFVTGNYLKIVGIITVAMISFMNYQTPVLTIRFESAKSRPNQVM